MKKTLTDLGDLNGKRVLIRVDFNVPLDKKSGVITNDRRIRPRADVEIVVNPFEAFGTAGVAAHRQRGIRRGCD